MNQKINLKIGRIIGEGKETVGFDILTPKDDKSYKAPNFDLVQRYLHDFLEKMTVVPVVSSKLEKEVNEQGRIIDAIISINVFESPNGTKLCPDTGKEVEVTELVYQVDEVQGCHVDEAKSIVREFSEFLTNTKMKNLMNAVIVERFFGADKLRFFECLIKKHVTDGIVEIFGTPEDQIPQEKQEVKVEEVKASGKTTREVEKF